MKSLRFAACSALAFTLMFQPVKATRAHGPASVTTFPEESLLGINPDFSSKISKIGHSVRSIVPGTEIPFEVTAFETDSAEDAEKAVEGLSVELKKALAQDPNGKYEIYLRLGDPNNPDHQKLDFEAFSLGKKLAETDDRISLSAANIPSDFNKAQSFEKKYWFKQNYRMTYALIRGFISTSVSYFTIMATPHMDAFSALSVGLVAGAMSFSLQKWSKEFYNWASPEVGIVEKLHQKAGALLNQSLANRHDTPQSNDLNSVMAPYKEDRQSQIKAKKSAYFSFLNRSEAYVRCYLAEVAYVVVVKATMSAMGMDDGFASLGNAIAAFNAVLVTSIYSTLAQDSWDLSITNSGRTAEKMKVLTKNQIDARSNLRYLITAAISMGLLVADLKEAPYIKYIFATLTTLGGITYFGSLYYANKVNKGEYKPKAASNRIVTSCHVLLKKVH